MDQLIFLVVGQKIYNFIVLYRQQNVFHQRLYLKSAHFCDLKKSFALQGCSIFHDNFEYATSKDEKSIAEILCPLSVVRTKLLRFFVFYVQKYFIGISNHEAGNHT